MPEKLERVLRLICGVLCAVLLWQLVMLVKGAGLEELRIPKTEVAQIKKSDHGKAEADPNSKHGPGPAPKLAPDVEEKVDRIYQSELLGPVIRPMPMELLGIGGKDAFIRTPNGQTGLLREGEELGGIKLLKIGTNRVLVEEKGKQKELIIFSGFGGETLVQKEQAQ